MKNKIILSALRKQIMDRPTLLRDIKTYTLHLRQDVSIDNLELELDEIDKEILKGEKEYQSFEIEEFVAIKEALTELITEKSKSIM